jgi:hypothetical protein
VLQTEVGIQVEMAADRSGTSSRSGRPSNRRDSPTARRARAIATKQSPKKLNNIDQHVARRLRMLRVLVGISQDELT